MYSSEVDLDFFALCLPFVKRHKKTPVDEGALKSEVIETTANENMNSFKVQVVNYLFIYFIIDQKWDWD